MQYSVRIYYGLPPSYMINYKCGFTKLGFSFRLQEKLEEKKASRAFIVLDKKIKWIVLRNSKKEKLLVGKKKRKKERSGFERKKQMVDINFRTATTRGFAGVPA